MVLKTEGPDKLKIKKKTVQMFLNGLLVSILFWIKYFLFDIKGKRHSGLDSLIFQCGFYLL